MPEETARILASGLQIIILAFMVVSGFWAARDARKRGRTMVEAFIWGLFVASFFLVGLISYLLLRNRLYQE
ncbi:MAG: hypothetical protein AB1815_09860 [Bacillota bacterium]